ncbi:MAG: recombinase family protein, partial [Pseudomonadota bacterium]
MIKAAIYARYSSDLQRDASIEDQIRLCTERAEREGWQIANCYTDHAISGASMIQRPGIQQLMQDAAAGRFQVVISEGLDRLSRDQEDIAGIYKRLQFASVCIFTVAEGEISNLHIGLKGTMNAIFLKDLALKIRRGLRGKVEKGLSGGSLPYGYDVARKFDANGEPIRGERSIKPEQAEIIRRIYRDYAAGRSPRAIAVQLNAKEVPGPTGRGWTPSAIHGNRRRGIGILNNEIYIGTLVWNRQQFIKDPDTGKRVPRFNPQSEWVRVPVPELRIVEQDLWDAVKERQRELPDKKEDFRKARRPRYLLSGLLKCGVCGGGFAKANHHRYGCATAKNKGTCSNKLKIPQEKLEKLVLQTLQDHLMDEELCKQFCEEYTRRMNELRSHKLAQVNSYKAEITRLEGVRKRIVKAVVEGYANWTLKEELDRAEARHEELEQLIETTSAPPVLLHPNMAHRYHKEVTTLVETIGNPERSGEAVMTLRSLVDRIVLTPNEVGDD